ncbi:hypothetical protein [Dyella agri]|uniref:Uncharacterized protein n=1 Tax=Dyella agri TaxID=1926869 RepID=A0ABW8KI35_9GAMM
MNRMYLKAGSALLLAVMFGQARAAEASHTATLQRMPDSYAQAAKLIDLGHGRFLNRTDAVQRRMISGLVDIDSLWGVPR